MSTSYSISELLSLDGIILHITADYQTEHLVSCPASILACDDTKLNELSELIASVYNWDSDRPSFTEASSESTEIEFGEAIFKLGIAPAVRQFLMGEITSIHEGKLDASYRCLRDGSSPLHHAVER